MATLEAVVAGNPVKQTFDAYRSQNRKWRQRVPAAAHICDALFNPPERELRSP